MADFNIYAPFLRSWEGGYVNHPNDPGGPTNAGVTLATWASYCKKYGFTANVRTLKAMTESQWREIMKGMYWDKLRCDDVRWQSVANLMCDWGVNSGISKAAMAIQKLVGVTADGVVGPKTIAAINAVKSKDVLFQSLKAARKQNYKNMVKADPKKATFLEGWLNRLDKVNTTYLELNDLRKTRITFV